MADQNSRPYGAGPNFRQQPAGGQGNDPLAELARLIGQTDPFGEYARRGQAPQPASQDYRTPPTAPDTGAFSAEQNYQYAQAEPHYGAESYPPQYEQPAYAAQNAPGQNYATPGYYDPRAGQGADEDVYDDAPPNRRRVTIIAVAAVFALAVLGTAAAVGYRAVFGRSGSSPPPVIKADTSPAKVVPPVSGEPSSNKLITDRVGNVQGERVVSREEQPIDLRDRPPPVFPGAQTAQVSSAAVSGSGVIGEPKKVRTIAIRPDQQGADNIATPTTAPAAPAARTSATPTPKAAPAPKPSAAVNTDDTSQAAPARPVASRPSGNAPMSLNPDTQAGPTPVRPATVRTASAPPARASTSSAGTGGYAVQVSSQRSEADAQASYRALQGKYPAQLGNRQPVIRRADLGDKGTYYRAVVEVGTADEATQLCTALKAAGGQCIIQRN